MKNQVYAFLDSIGVQYDRESHAPAFHMDDCVEISDRMNAAHCKNYFLTTKSKKIHCLCLVRPNARLKTSDVSKQAGTPRLSFADEAAMMELLHVHPGSVSPMGLIFDKENRVRLLVDRDVLLYTLQRLIVIPLALFLALAMLCLAACAPAAPATQMPGGFTGYEPFGGGNFFFDA